ncbi:hypothetical protein C5167_019590 [Papaver somniferum]|uniref:Uncharacterized protein n=1 Tax=Papaver somniferum TaxID=3469 RepID=A0A4Y7IR44_PAPSO|nr:hypothetical protein C5167_019590 [Papaver somniferum]
MEAERSFFMIILIIMLVLGMFYMILKSALVPKEDQSQFFWNKNQITEVTLRSSESNFWLTIHAKKIYDSAKCASMEHNSKMLELCVADLKDVFWILQRCS